MAMTGWDPAPRGLRGNRRMTPGPGGSGCRIVGTGPGRRRGLLFALGLAAVLLLAVAPAQAVVLICDEDIVAIGSDPVGSGNGTLDFLLFTESSGGAENSDGAFDGDDANTDMPTGVGNTTVSESFITSFGDLRSFYLAQFSDGNGGATINEIVLFVDLNELTGSAGIQLDALDIVIDYTQAFGDSRDDPFGNDIPSNLQNATGTGYSGGTLLAGLDSPKLLPLNVQGAGFADYMIRTHINPFDDAYSDETRILVYWASKGHSDGGESIFLSGEYGSDTMIPEPATLGLVVLGAALLATWRRRR
jgi:hypothetical protein